MRIKILAILLFSISFSYSQNYNKDYFRLPVNIPIRLAGNFGEIRTNHFHSGIDIKVPQIGVKIFAAADGYISRIRKSADGYGNTLYITHSNGLRTVYGHMNRFRKDIEIFLEKEQYKNKRFEITLYPDSDLFKVKKGDLIGYAGNSGRSYGPHVHFEIREAEKDIPLNPGLFNFNIKDKIKPKIFYAEILPLKNNSSVNGKFQKQIFKTYYKNSNYYISKPIYTEGDIGIAVNACDYMNYVKNTQGICSVRMFVDDTLYFAYKIEKISFNETRYINSFIDYAEKQLTHRNFQKLWKEPGNKIKIYKTQINNGILNFSDNKFHNIKIQLSDCYNNSTFLFIKIKGNKPKFEEKPEKNIINYDKNNFFEKPDFRALIKKGCLYTNISINYKIYPQKKDLYSDIHQLNSYLIPAHENIYYAIKPKNLPKNLISKALIVNIDKKGNYHPLGGYFINGFISGKCKCFGKFAVAVDTLPPVISIKNKGINDNNFSKEKIISFIITDNISGIKSYEAEIDGNFILFEYDKKNNKIYYKFDNHISFNKQHTLKLTVIDKKNNKSVLNFTFFK